MITLNAHALNRVVNCNGSHFMPPSEVPDDQEQTDDQREGIAAHWVAMEVISGRHSDPIEFVDRQVPGVGVWVTPDMAEHIDPFVQDVLSRNATPHIEETVDFQLSPNVRINCRLDLATYDAATGTLTIDELKYGYRLVEPIDNWQLVAEAIGWTCKHNDKPINKVILNVHQPRPHHPDGKKRSLELQPFQWNELVGRLHTALEHVSQELNTGPQCYKCPAMLHCPAYNSATNNAIDASGVVFNDRLTNDEAVEIFRTVKRAKEILDQKAKVLEEMLTHRISSGQVIKDHFIEPQYGNTKFIAGVNPEMIKALTGIDISKKSLPTPKQAIKAGVSELIIKAFTYRPMTGQKLVHKSAAKVAAGMFNQPKD